MKRLLRPITTLFMIESLDGKISSGNSDKLDVDKDWKRIRGVKEGLNQYYKIEQTTDLYSLNSGRVFRKIGINLKQETPKKTPLSYIVIDSKPHLNKVGLKYLSEKCKNVFIVTTNKNHPANGLKSQCKNIEIIEYKKTIDFKNLFRKLKSDFKIDRLTVQSGGTLNAKFIRSGLIDYISVVIAPLLVGGKQTPTLMDGTSLTNRSELKNIKSLKLIRNKTLQNSYIHLLYSVNK